MLIREELSALGRREVGVSEDGGGGTRGGGRRVGDQGAAVGITGVVTPQEAPTSCPRISVNTVRLQLGDSDSRAPRT